MVKTRSGLRTPEPAAKGTKRRAKTRLAKDTDGKQKKSAGKPSGAPKKDTSKSKSEKATEGTCPCWLYIFLTVILAAAAGLVINPSQSVLSSEEIVKSVTRAIEEFRKNQSTATSSMIKAIRSGVETPARCSDRMGKYPLSIMLSGTRTKEKKRFLKRVIDAGFAGCTYELRPSELAIGLNKKIVDYSKRHDQVCAVVLWHAEALGDEISQMEPLLDTCFEFQPPVIIMEAEKIQSSWREALMGRITHSIDFDRS